MSTHASLTDPNIHEIKGAATATAGQIPVATGAGTAPFATVAGINTSGSFVKAGTTLSQATSTGTTLIPYDNTIPQITEGDQYLTSAWTPAATGNKIKVKAVILGSYSVAAVITAALFKDATANALAAVAVQTTAVNQITMITLEWEITAASTALTNFYVRVGGSTAGTFTFNGNAGVAVFGGVASSSLTITEAKA